MVRLKRRLLYLRYILTNEYATIAEFRLLRPLKVLDLTKPNHIKLPSLFDEDKRNQRAPLLFLRRFAQDISQKSNQENNIDYVPTQIVTEYFKHVFRIKNMEPIDGIVYCSAQNDGGKCIVLFIDKDDCVDTKGNDKGVLLMNTSGLSQFKKEFRPVESGLTK